MIEADIFMSAKAFSGNNVAVCSTCGNTEIRFAIDNYLLSKESIHLMKNHQNVRQTFGKFLNNFRSNEILKIIRAGYDNLADVRVFSLMENCT